jgi:hypothetical protein
MLHKQIRKLQHRRSTLLAGVGTPWPRLESCFGSGDSEINFGFASYLDRSGDFGAVEGIDEGESFCRFRIDILFKLVTCIG